MMRNESGDFTLHFSFYCAFGPRLHATSVFIFNLSQTKGMSAEGKIHILPENQFGCTDIKIMINTLKPIIILSCLWLLWLVDIKILYYTKNK